MGGPVYSMKRLWNPDLVIDANNVLPRKCIRYVYGHTHTMYYQKWLGTTQAGEEMGTAADSAKDGTTTPFPIIVVSASALDDRGNAAGTVHSVALIGISVASILDYQNGVETPLKTVEVVAMDGQTDVNSTRQWLWCDHAYACEWGTGATHDAEGDITIESPVNVDLLTIKATFNESNGGIWHCRAGDTYITRDVGIEPTAATAVADGVFVTLAYTGFDHTLNDSNVADANDFFTFILGGGIGTHHKEATITRYATSTAKILMSEGLIANGLVFQIETYIEVKHN